MTASSTTGLAPRCDVGPSVPGYALGAQIGIGGRGTVWTAVRLRDRADVVVKVVAGQPFRSRDQVVGRPTEADVQRNLRHPHLIALLDEVPLSDGRLALVLEPARGGSLARVVGARGQLTPGETATVLVAVATALAEAHRLGVVHGDLSPGNVLFHRDGRPMVGDFGGSRLAVAAMHESEGTRGFVDPGVLLGERPSPASDVYAVAMLGWFALTGLVPPHPVARGLLADLVPEPARALARVLDQAAGDPCARPSAAELARLVYDAGPPEPVLLAGDDDPASELTRRIRQEAVADATGSLATRPARHRRQARLRAGPRTLVALSVALLIVAAVAVGLTRFVGSGRVERPAAGVAPTSTATLGTAPADIRWPQVLQELSAARAAAFADPALGAAAFDQPGSSAYQRDSAELASLRAKGTRYVGLRLTTRDVQVLSQDGQRARVRAAVTRSSYQSVVGEPQTSRAVEAAPETVVTFTLVRDQQGRWRVTDAQ